MPLTTINTAGLESAWSLTRRGAGTCVGKPLEGIDIRIIRVTDTPIARWSHELAVPVGTVGEIVAGGAVVSPEYPDLPEETKRAKITCGDRVLHRMGDLGYLDSDGSLWFCGRKSHRVETGRRMIPPVPIENIMNEHPAVFRSAVVGVGPRDSQTAVACLEMETGWVCSPRIKAQLNEMIQGTEYDGIVKNFLVHPGFPVDARHNSKIRRGELALWASSAVPAGTEL